MHSPRSEGSSSRPNQSTALYCRGRGLKSVDREPTCRCEAEGAMPGPDNLWRSKVGVSAQSLLLAGSINAELTGILDSMQPAHSVQ